MSFFIANANRYEVEGSESESTKNANEGNIKCIASRFNAVNSVLKSPVDNHCDRNAHIPP